jgi:hypothetical protein
MRPSLKKWYQVGDLHLYNLITTIIKEYIVSFLKEDLFGEQGLCTHCPESTLLVTS